MFTIIPVPSTRYIYSMNLHHIPHRKEDDLKLVEYIDKLSKEQYPSTPSNIMSWRSEWNSHHVHREVMKCFLGDLFRVFADDIVFPMASDPESEIFLIDSWMSVQRKGDWIRRHDHHGFYKYHSFCYYLNMSNDSAPIRFHQYNIPAPSGQVSDRVFDIYPAKGTLLIFDDAHQHSVDDTIDDRFTISGNISFQQKIIDLEDGLPYLSMSKFFNNEK